MACWCSGPIKAAVRTIVTVSRPQAFDLDESVRLDHDVAGGDEAAGARFMLFHMSHRGNGLQVENGDIDSCRE